MKNKGTALAISFILLQSLLYGFGDPISKAAYYKVSVYSLLTARYWIATICLLLVFSRRIIKDLRSNDWKPLLLPSLCIAGSFLISNVAIGITSPTTVSFLRSTAVILTPLLALVVLRTKYSLKHVPILAVVMVGLYLLCNPGGAIKPGLGELLALISALFAAGSLVFAEDALEKLDAITITTFQSLTSAAMATICAFLFEGGVRLGNADANVWLTILYLAITCTLLGYVLQNFALKSLSSNAVALLQTTYPVMTAVFSFFILRERLGIKGIAGAIIIMACVIAENIVSAKEAGASEKEIRQAENEGRESA